MSTIGKNINFVKNKIYDIAKNCGRDGKEISLIAVSKSKSIEDISIAIKFGLREFGESYVQESIKKILWFRNNKYKEMNLVWHFVGHLQSNKSKFVAEYFDWCHTIDNIKISKKLENKRPTELPPLNVLIQVNIENNNKFGVEPNQVLEFASYIIQFKHLKLRGIMTITDSTKNSQRKLKNFRYVFNLYQKLKSIYPNIDTLSLGMTQDMTEAIIAGSTLLRIGTAIFGKRNK